MQLFYNPILQPDESKFCFDKNESRHIIKVLRKEIGDNLLITNGLGCFFEATIVSNNQNKCDVKINSVTVVPRKDYNIHLAVAPTKTNDRYEWFLEKATEIGVDTITPIICSRSERKVIKAERYEKIIQAAAKQSLRAYFPILNPAVRFTEFIKNNTIKERFIAHCLEDQKVHLKDAFSIEKDVLILIGPEGDFTQEEIKMAQESGFKAVSLGDARLRTETAAIAACHTITLCNA
jgi:16S rRNA (uracil1498-N3)-methyltransferase